METVNGWDVKVKIVLRFSEQFIFIMRVFCSMF